MPNKESLLAQLASVSPLEPLGHADLIVPLEGGGELNVHESVRLLDLAGLSLPLEAEPGSVPWLQALVDGLCQLSSRDALTGLANRRSFELALRREADRAARTGEAALVMLLDLDHFKPINDTYGHPAGDVVIKSVAHVLAQHVRPMDVVARVGGEEFAIIMPNCAPHAAQVACDRLVEAVAAHEIAIPHGPRLKVTLSVGGAFAPQWVRSLPALWVERADAQLYLAKSQGRNRACLEAVLPLQVSAEERGMLFGLHDPQEKP